jgi:hypothetical protein
VDDGGVAVGIGGLGNGGSEAVGTDKVVVVAAV